MLRLRVCFVGGLRESIAVGVGSAASLVVEKSCEPPPEQDAFLPTNFAGIEKHAKWRVVANEVAIPGTPRSQHALGPYMDWSL